MNRASPRSSVMYHDPSDAYASCSWLKWPIPVRRFCAPVAGSISHTQPERRSGSFRNGNSSFVRYVFHGVIAAAQRLWRPVVISSRFKTVVPSFASVRREIEPQPSESSSPGVCSSTWHFPASPWKSPCRGCVGSCCTSSHITPPGAWNSAFPSGSSGIGYVTPLSVDCSGVTQPVASVVYENPAGRSMRPFGSGWIGCSCAVAVPANASAATNAASKHRFISPLSSACGKASLKRRRGAALGDRSRGRRPRVRVVGDELLDEVVRVVVLDLLRRRLHQVR